MDDYAPLVQEMQKAGIIKPHRRGCGGRVGVVGSKVKVSESADQKELFGPQSPWNAQAQVGTLLNDHQRRCHSLLRGIPNELDIHAYHAYKFHCNMKHNSIIEAGLNLTEAQ